MLILLAIVSLSYADDHTERLPGCEVSVAKKQWTLHIVEARLLQLGVRQEPGVMRCMFPQAKIEPLRAIKGGFGRGSSAPRQVGILASDDTVLHEGESYIFYIFDANRGSYASKLTRRDGAIPIRMPGSELNLADAEEQADYVIEAEIGRPTEGELLDPRRPRIMKYRRVAIEPKKVIKETGRGAGMAIREVSLLFTEDEADLVGGKTYVLYIRKRGQEFEVFRATQFDEGALAHLPGSRLSGAAAEREALYVAEGRILRLGEMEEDRTRPHGLVYPLVSIEQSRVIKGRHEGFVRSKRDVRLLLTEDEAVPNEGQTYIFYVRSRDRGFEVFKVMRGPSEKPR